MQIKIEKMRTLKPKSQKPKRDEWKRVRKAARKAKQFVQDYQLSA